MNDRPSRAPGLDWLLPALLATAALLGASQAPSLVPGGLLPEPGLALLLVAAIGLAALHRPLAGTSLGLGALGLLLALARVGTVPAALAVGVALATAEALRRRLARRLGAVLPERRRPQRLVGAVAAAILAALAAGLAATALAGPGQPLFPAAPAALSLVAVLAGAAFVAPPLLLELFVRRLRQPEDAPAPEPPSRASLLQSVGLDLLGWCGGCAIAWAATRGGGATGVVLLALVALLAGEAARNGLQLAENSRRLGELLKANREAVRRIVAANPQRAGIAHQVLIECRNILAFTWFQFELFPPDGERKSWWAGADSGLEEGEPAPESAPPPLPGFHRRPAWRRIDHPLVAEGEQVGRLRLWCDPRLLDPASLELLDALLPQMAASVQSALRERGARARQLPGAAGRGGLARGGPAARATCRERGPPLAIVMCDLDHFKRINDTWGHGAGDQALRLVSRVLLEHCREHDLCARYGGEEFTLLLEATNGATALEIAERLREVVAGLLFAPQGERVTLTLSAGVAAYPELHLKTASELLLLADGALYEAKRQGRNRCLLDLGQGRYRTPEGEEITGSGEPPALKPPPQIFA